MSELEMRELAALSAGEYQLFRRKPWWQMWRPRVLLGQLTVERDRRGHTTVMLTNLRKINHPIVSDPPARALTIKPCGTLFCYIESGKTNWVKWGYGLGGDEELRSALSFAKWVHGQLCLTGSRWRKTRSTEVQT